MQKKLLYIALGILFAIGGTVSAAPTVNIFRTLLPETTATYDLGSVLKVWNNLYVNQICLSADCKSAWPTGGGGSGGGSWSTTTSQVVGRLINYPNNNTDIVNIGSTSTTTGKFWFDPNTSTSFLTTANIPKLSNLTSNGFVKTSGGDGTLSVDTATYLSSVTADSPLSGSGTSGSHLTLSTAGTWSGNAGTATALASGRTISISGDLTYTSPSFDGTGNVTAAGTLATVNSNVGTFNTLTVNGKGLVTAASNTSYENPLTFTYPILRTTNTISLAFGTTTSNTWAGTQTFTNAPIFSSLTGLLKGNGSSAITVGANGTDYTLITANTCGAGQHVSAITAAGAISCSADTGSGGSSGTISTSTPLVSGQVDFSTGVNTIGNDSNFIWDNTNKRLGVGSTTPASILSIGGDAVGINFSLSTTTFSTTGGVNLTKGGCFAISGTCIGNISSLNGLTGAIQTFATTSTNGGFGFSSSGTVHTLNIPTASASSLGLLTAADWSTFNSKQATISVTSPITLTGASVGIVNQGTTAQVLHGNASGNASFGAIVNADITNSTIDLTTKVTGILPIANGGTATSTQVTNGVNYFDGTKITSGTTFTFISPALGLGTTTPNPSLGQFQISTSSGAGFKPQLILSDQGATTNQKHANIVMQGGTFSIGSSTDQYATSTTQAFAVNMKAGVSAGMQIATGTAETAVTSALINLGANPISTNASTTIHMAKVQFEGYDAGGTLRCSFFTSAGVFTSVTGSCNN